MRFRLRHVRRLVDDVHLMRADALLCQLDERVRDGVPDGHLPELDAALRAVLRLVRRVQRRHRH